MTTITERDTMPDLRHHLARWVEDLVHDARVKTAQDEQVDAYVAQSGLTREEYLRRAGLYFGSTILTQYHQSRHDLAIRLPSPSQYRLWRVQQGGEVDSYPRTLLRALVQPITISVVQTPEVG